MDDSYSDNSELYIELRDMERNRKSIPRNMPPQSAHLLQGRAAHDDNHQMLVALYYWRQKLCHKTFHAWRQLVPSRRSTRRREVLAPLLSRPDDDLHRQARPRRTANSILRRHQESMKTNRKLDDNDQPSSDESSVWGIRLSSSRRALRPPVSSSNDFAISNDPPDAVVERQRKAVAQLTRQQEIHRLKMHAIKTRYSLLDGVVSTWKSAVDATRPLRLALAGRAIAHHRCTSLKKTWAQWSHWFHRKHRSRMARTFAAQTIYEYVFRGWIYVTSVARAGALVRAKHNAKAHIQHWRQWALAFSTHQKWRVLIFYLSSQRCHKELRRLWRLWRLFASTSRQSRRHRHVATAHLRAMTLSKGFRQWHQASDVNLADEIRMRRTLAQGMAVRRWRAWTAQQRQEWARRDMAFAWCDRQLTKTYMRAWRRYLLLRAHCRHQRRRADGFATSSHIRTAFHTWHCQSHQLAIARTQCDVAATWCNSHTRLRMFRRWLGFVTRRRHHRLAVLHCYSVTTENMFYAWRRWTEAVGAARCRAMDVAHIHAMRHLQQHFRAWQTSAHRRHYVHMLRCRLQMRRNFAILRRHYHAWTMYVRPKTRQRRLCMALRGQRILRFVQRVLQEWAGVVDTRHAWRKFVVQLDDTHTAKRVRFGFHQWRLHATGSAVAASRNRRLQDQVMVRWTEWTLHQRTRHRHEKLAEQWHTCKTNERSLTAWWTHVQLQRQSRESMTRIQEMRGRSRIQRLWQTWRGRFVIAKRVRQATTWHNRQLLRRMWLGFQVALQLVAVENKRRRAAQALLTRKLSLSMFGRWVQYVAGRRHDRELDALARDLVACHQATRMFHAWKAVHAKRQVQRRWRTQWVHTQLRQAVRQWHALAAVLAGRTWTAVSSRRHYATGLFRKVMYAWSDAVALERHLRATAARSVQHLQACQLKQAVARLQLNANVRQMEASAASRAETFYKRRRAAVAVTQLRRRADDAKRRTHQRTAAESVYRRRVTRRVLGAMRVVAQRSRYIRGMLVDALGVQATAKSKYMFGRWVQFVTQARHAHTVAHAFQSRTLRRRVMQWHDVAKHQRRCRALMESTRRILFGNVVRTSMVAWVSFTTQRRRKARCAALARTHAVLRSRRQAWRAWVVVHVREGNLEMALGARRRRHLGRLWADWRQVVQKHRMRQVQLELATLHDAAKCMRQRLSLWRHVTRVVRELDQAMVVACRRKQKLRRAWKRWVRCRHDVMMLRRATCMWSQRFLHMCFRLWSVFRTYRVRKQWLAVQSRAFCRHRRLGGAFDHWKRLQGRRQVKLAREDAAISHDHIRVCRPCFHAWVAGARKTKKTKQILAVAFRRDATMTMFRCFRGWQQLFRRAQSSRQAMHDYDSAMLGFHAVKAIAKWRKRTNAMQTTRQQHSRAMDFLERRLRAACFDAWVLQGYVRQERQLKNQLAIDHAHAVSTRRRFDRWLEFTYVQYQMAQAEHHHAAALAQHAWSMWMAFMQSRMCTDDEVASAVAHCHMQLRRRVWRRWQVYCVAQLQKRMARCHYAATRLRLYFLAWIGLRDHMERLRHARTYWEASTLSVRFRQWTRFITTRRVRHAQLRVFAGLQQRQAVRRWRHNARTAKQHKRQVLWASSLFYESSLASIFRAWRSMFQCEMHKKLQDKRAVSHLICKGLRRYFERWRVVQRRQRHLREAKHMAELHLAVSRQRRGVRWLREHVQDHHHAQTIWHYVEASCNDHVHRRLFGAWKTYVATRQAKLELHRTAAIHFGGRTQRVIFGAWVAYVVRTRYLKAQVYRSRHLYFSSLYSRSFFRLRRFATLKRRLRHVTDQVCRRRRQEWFDRWKKFRDDAHIATKRSARASMLYRKSHLRRLFNHWKSVACERWMRQWLVSYAAVVRHQSGLALAIRRWWAATEASKQVKALRWRMRHAQLVANAMNLWQQATRRAKIGRQLQVTTTHRRQSKALHAWMHALVAVVE